MTRLAKLLGIQRLKLNFQLDSRLLSHRSQQIDKLDAANRGWLPC
jgi:hypothetical protein